MVLSNVLFNFHTHWREDDLIDSIYFRCVDPKFIGKMVVYPWDGVYGVDTVIKGTIPKVPTFSHIFPMKTGVIFQAFYDIAYVFAEVSP